MDQLVHFGLTVSSSVYGGLFYALIGAHGVHVLAPWWGSRRICSTRKGRYSRKDYNGMKLQYVRIFSSRMAGVICLVYLY